MNLALIAAMAVSLQGPATPDKVTDKATERAVELDANRVPAIKTKGDCLLKGGTLLTVSGGELVGYDLLVQRGKIVKIGKDLTPPVGVTVIDAKGKFVSPGLIDAHTHLATDATNEGSDAITPECRIEDVLNPQARGLYYKLAAGTTSSLTLHGSANPIGGESKIIKHKYRGSVADLTFPGAPRVVKFALGENVTQANRGTSDNPRYPATRMGVDSVYRRAFTEAREYLKSKKAGKKVRKDLRLEALADMLEGRIIIHCHGYRQDEMLSLVRVCKEFGVKLVAFQHALESYKIAPELAAAGIGASLFVDHWAYKIEAYDTTPYAASILQNAGVLVSVNTDSGSGVTPFQLDAAKTMRYGGVSGPDVLKMVTLNAAKHLQIDGRVGSLEAGKDADIAVWDGYPLSVYSRCALTLVDGEVLFQRRDAFNLDKSSTFAKVAPKAIQAPPLSLPRADLIAIVNGTVHPITGAEIAGGTVVIRQGIIVAVGKVPVPKGAKIVDAKGLHVYPGLIDAGSDIGRVEFDSTRATNDDDELGTYQPDLVALSAVYPDSEKIPVTRLGGITLAHTRPGASGAVVAGQGSVIRMDGLTPLEMVVNEKAGLVVNFPEGTSALTEFQRNALAPDAQAALGETGNRVIDELEELFGKVKRYDIARSADADTPVDSRLEAMRPYVIQKKPVIFRANTPSGIRGAIAFAERVGVKPIIEGGKESWKVAELLASKKVPVLLFVPIWTSPTAGSECSPSRDYDPYDSAFALAGLLERAGVQFAFESGNSEGSGNLPVRVGHTCAWGLSPKRALEALTIDSARILGLADTHGSLEVGKQADVIITDGDPLEVTTSIRGMLIAGKPASLESRWSRLNDRYKGRAPKR